MKLSAPKVITWVIALIIGLVGVVGHLANVSALADYNLWIVVVAWVLMLVATYVKGL